MESDVVTLQDIFSAKPPDEETAQGTHGMRLLGGLNCSGLKPHFLEKMAANGVTPAAEVLRGRRRLGPRPAPELRRRKLRRGRTGMTSGRRFLCLAVVLGTLGAPAVAGAEVEIRSVDATVVPARAGDDRHVEALEAPAAADRERRSRLRRARPEPRRGAKHLPRRRPLALHARSAARAGNRRRERLRRREAADRQDLRDVVRDEAVAARALHATWARRPAPRSRASRSTRSRARRSTTTSCSRRRRSPKRTTARGSSSSPPTETRRAAPRRWPTRSRRRGEAETTVYVVAIESKAFTPGPLKYLAQADGRQVLRHAVPRRPQGHLRRAGERAEADMAARLHHVGAARRVPEARRAGAGARPRLRARPDPRDGGARKGPAACCRLPRTARAARLGLALLVGLLVLIALMLVFTSAGADRVRAAGAEAHRAEAEADEEDEGEEGAPPVARRPVPHHGERARRDASLAPPPAPHRARRPAAEDGGARLHDGRLARFSSGC